MKTQMFRQGDVLLVSIASLPQFAKPLQRDSRGRAVLAYGEVTGHAHAIEEIEATTMADVDGGIRYLDVGPDAPLIDSWRCLTGNGETVFVPAYERPEAWLPPLRVVGRENVNGVVLKHEEHGHLVLAPGAYRIGGNGAAKQREYTPEAIINVTD